MSSEREGRISGQTQGLITELSSTMEESARTQGQQRVWGWLPLCGTAPGRSSTALTDASRNMWQIHDAQFAPIRARFLASDEAGLSNLSEWLYSPIPPWSTTLLRPAPWRKPLITECLNHIIDRYMAKRPHEEAEERRLEAWRRTCHLADLTEEDLFPLLQGLPIRDRYALFPQPLSPSPLQRGFVSSYAIPSWMADLSPFASGLVPPILSSLAPGYQELHLSGFNLETYANVGELYVHLRAVRASKGHATPASIFRKQQEDATIRRDALQGGCIRNPRIPPRRIWDLASNRVIPFYLLHFLSPQQPSKKIWTVSHSWVHVDDRVDVWTPINAYMWPVPMPKATALDHVRTELLNLGAEYVWLDILCLRQRGREEDEQQRKEEWELDVPTIGYIYSLDTPCITYFNGLGLPFDPSPNALASPRHWLNRVWTVQEASSAWIPGGLTGLEKGAGPKPRAQPEWLRREHADASLNEASDDLRALLSEVSKNDGEDPNPDVCDFFYRRHANAIPADRRQLLSYWSFAIKAMKGRHSSTPLDRIHALAYILKCDTLPIYDEQVSPELAWDILLKHLYPYVRNLLLLQHLKLNPSSQSLLPSLDEFMDLSLTDEDHHIGWLFLLRPSCLGAAEPGTYYQDVDAFHPSFYLRLILHDEAQKSVVLVDAADTSRSYMVGCHDATSFELQTKYRILKVDYRMWMVVEDVGLRVYPADGEQEGGRGALEAREVIKRGCISVRRIEKALPPCETLTAVYL